MRRTHRLVRVFHILTLILALAHGYASCVAQDRKPPSAETVMNSGNAGTEFFIAIPPNEILPYPVEGLEIYIASADDADVELFDYATNEVNRFKIKPFEILTLSDDAYSRNPVLDWSMEIRDAETPVRRALRLTSDKPISVYVLNSKKLTTDGYLAIPVRNWGTEYISCSYFDFRELKPWAGGFAVIAKEPTNLKIQLRGAGKGLAKTSGGRSIGDVIDVTLDEGEVYMVHGDGQTRGQFDLTGSLITADKPVGVIGFHMRTTMPNMLINGNGRNHLCEMLPPVKDWGTRYVTLELQREHLLNGRGDMFRVVAKDDETKWTCKYYDKTSGMLLGERSGLLRNAGDFADELQATQPTALVEGFSVWEADKPIFLMQYSCSSSWDGDQILDPLMFCVTAEDQFATGVQFQTPTLAQFSRHYLNLVIETDTSDPNLIANLKSLVIDNEPIWSHPKASQPKLLSSRMPNGMYFATIEFGSESLAHRVTGNGRVRFGGYVYGFGAVDAYGWPITIGKISSIQTSDNMPPVITTSAIPGKCGSFRCDVTELRNVPDPVREVPARYDQVETGIAAINSAPGSNSFNYKRTLVTAPNFPFTNPYTRFQVDWTVIDTTKPAKVVVLASDYAGNRAFDTLTYKPATTIDTAKPVIVRKLSKPALWDLVVTEMTNTPNPPRECAETGDQLDKGLLLVSVQRVNMGLSAGNLKFLPDSMVPKAELSVFVEDISQKASCIVNARDRAGNMARDTIVYNPTTDVHIDDAAPTAISTMLSSDGHSVTVTLPEGAVGLTLGLYDIQGRLLKSVPLVDVSHVTVDLSELQAGVYVICVAGADRPCSKPFVCAP